MPSTDGRANEPRPNRGQVEEEREEVQTQLSQAKLEASRSTDSQLATEKRIVRAILGKDESFDKDP